MPRIAAEKLWVVSETTQTLGNYLKKMNIPVKHVMAPEDFLPCLTRQGTESETLLALV